MPNMEKQKTQSHLWEIRWHHRAETRLVETMRLVETHLDAPSGGEPCRGDMSGGVWVMLILQQPLVGMASH